MTKEQKKQIYAIRRGLLRKLINEHYNGNQTLLAQGLDLPSSNIGRLLTQSQHRRNVADNMARRIERHFGLPEGWMDDPKNLDPTYLKMLETQAQHREDNPFVEHRPTPAAIPLFAVATAATYLQHPTAIPVSRWVGSTIPRSSQMFAVEVPDQLMCNPQAPISFNKGDILLIEPTIEPASGDMVLVVLADEIKTATIAELTVGLDGVRHIRYINPDNNQPVSLSDQATIAGVVVERQSRIYNNQTLQQRLYSA